MLPALLLGPFTAEDAAAHGVGARTLARLRAAGLAVAVEDKLRLVEPVDEVALALVVAGPTAALCGTSAASHYGWSLLHPPEAVHLAVENWRRPVSWPGLRIHRWAVAEQEIVVVGGRRVTRPARTALDVAATAPLAEGLVLLDGLLRNRVLDRRHLTDGMDHMPKRPGRLRAACAVALADPRHASPPESVFRALVHENGLPAPACQFVLRVDGRFVARGDFAWPERRLLVEIDGLAHHSDTKTFVRDRRRQNEVVLAGWRVLRFAATEVLAHPDTVVAAVRNALRLPLPKAQ